MRLSFLILGLGGISLSAFGSTPLVDCDLKEKLVTSFLTYVVPSSDKTEAVKEELVTEYSLEELERMTKIAPILLRDKKDEKIGTYGYVKFLDNFIKGVEIKNQETFLNLIPPFLTPNMSLKDRKDFIASAIEHIDYENQKIKNINDIILKIIFPTYKKMSDEDHQNALESINYYGKKYPLMFQGEGFSKVITAAYNPFQQKIDRAYEGFATVILKKMLPSFNSLVSGQEGTKDFEELNKHLIKCLIRQVSYPIKEEKKKIILDISSYINLKIRLYFLNVYGVLEI